MPTYLAFGDSNTHGSVPYPDEGASDRHEYGVRWPSVAYRALPEGWVLAEEGLPGRTTSRPDPVMGAHMDGWLGFRIALATHKPDLISIMLGTNDLKTRFGMGPEAITAGLAGLLDILVDTELAPRVLLIAPVPVEVTDERAAEWQGAAEKSRALATHLAELAASYGVEFLDAGAHANVHAEEGIHLEAEAHMSLGRAIGQKLAAMI